MAFNQGVAARDKVAALRAQQRPAAGAFVVSANGSSAVKVRSRIAALRVRAKIDALKAAPKSKPAKAKGGVHVALLPAQVAAIKSGETALTLTVAQLDAVHSQQGNILLMAYGPDGHLRFPLD